MQVLDTEPSIVTPGVVWPARLQQHNIHRQTTARDQPANIGDIGRDHILSAIREKPSPRAGATQRGDSDVAVGGGKAVAEGQWAENPELRAAVCLGIKPAGEEYWFSCSFGPANGLAGADQLGKIKRLWRDQRRGFHFIRGRTLGRLCLLLP